MRMENSNTAIFFEEPVRFPYRHFRLNSTSNLRQNPEIKVDTLTGGPTTIAEGEFLVVVKSIKIVAK